MTKRPIDLGLVAEGDRILRDARARDPTALADAIEKALEGDTLVDVVEDAEDEQDTGKAQTEGTEE